MNKQALSAHLKAQRRKGTRVSTISESQHEHSLAR
jgi:hypothetical protein